MEWIVFNPLTYTYDSRDGTSVPAEMVGSANCLADVLNIAVMRSRQRGLLVTLPPPPVHQEEEK